MSRRSLAAVIPSAFPTASGVNTHGLGRKPSRADLTPIRPELLAAFNRGTARAVRANRLRIPNDPPPLTIPCQCGGMFATAQGLRIHGGQHCVLRRTK